MGLIGVVVGGGGALLVLGGAVQLCRHRHRGPSCAHCGEPLAVLPPREPDRAPPLWHCGACGQLEPPDVEDVACPSCAEGRLGPPALRRAAADTLALSQVCEGCGAVHVHSYDAPARALRGDEVL